MEIIKSKENEKVNNIKIKRKEKILMEKGKKALDIKKMKKQAKRNNLDSISRNHSTKLLAQWSKIKKKK